MNTIYTDDSRQKNAPSQEWAHGLVAATGTSLSAGTIGADIFGLFNIFVGLMVVAAILMFVTGLIVWAVRLGIVGRSEGIRYMEWGVVILFVLVVVLAIVRFFAANTAAVTFLIAGVIALFVGWILMQVIKGGGGAEKEDH